MQIEGTIWDRHYVEKRGVDHTTKYLGCIKTCL